MKILTWKKHDPAEKENRRQRQLFCAQAVEMIRTSILPVKVIEKKLGEFVVKGHVPTMDDLVGMRCACHDYISQIEQAAETARQAFEAAE